MKTKDIAVLFLSAVLVVFLISVTPLLSSEEEPSIGEQIETLEGVIKEADFLLKENPEDIKALFGRGTAHFRLGNLYMFICGTINSDEHLEKAKKEFISASEDFTSAIEIEPEFYQAYISRGMCYGMMGLSTAALADFDYVIENDPENAGAYYARGREYWDMREFEKAKRDYDKAVELDPVWEDSFYMQ
jgi:tetratricopeptide (TPR) repeat protein